MLRQHAILIKEFLDLESALHLNNILQRSEKHHKQSPVPEGHIPGKPHNL